MVAGVAWSFSRSQATGEKIWSGPRGTLNVEVLLSGMGDQSGGPLAVQKPQKVRLTPSF